MTIRRRHFLGVAATAPIALPALARDIKPKPTSNQATQAAEPQLWRQAGAGSRARPIGDKLAELPPSPLDFESRSDGSDLTSAAQSGRSVFFERVDTKAFVAQQPDDAPVKLRNNSVLRGQGPYTSELTGNGKNMIISAGMHPVVVTPPVIQGGGLENFSIDAGFDTEHPPAGWADTAITAIWVSGFVDWRLDNVVVQNSPDYALGLENGRRVRAKIRDFVSVGTMNDSIDSKNNGSFSRDGSMIGVWAEQFGRKGGSGEFAGVDIGDPNWSLSQIWATRWGDKGHVAGGIRFKFGEAKEPRGLAGYKCRLNQFQIEYSSGSEFSSPYGVLTDHRRTLMSQGHIDGPLHSGIRICQEHAIISDVDIRGAARGVYAHSKPKQVPTTPTHILANNIRAFQPQSEGLRLEAGADKGFYSGVQVIGGPRAINVAGNYNFVLGMNDGAKVAVVDSGTGNWIGIFDATTGVLDVHRKGLKSYSFGDFVTMRNAVGSAAARFETHDGKTWLDVFAAHSPGRARLNSNAAIELAYEDKPIAAIEQDRVRMLQPVELPTFAVKDLPEAKNISGAVVFCRNGDSGRPCLAVSDGKNWARVALGAPVSAS